MGGGDVAGLQSGLLDDDALLQRILRHLDAGSTDLSDETWREPVANYRSELRLEREVAIVLRRQPVPFCPSAALAGSGAFVAREAAGVPLLAVRGRDGDVKVFRNACRHRGAAVASGSGCVKALTCPYHGWTYRLDGTLQRVPDDYGFPGLDRATRGLVPVHAVEQSGLVIVCQEPGGGPRLEVETSFPRLIDADQELFDATDQVVETSWKVLVEGFLEGYHLRATHRTTFLPFGYDNLTIVETFGRHSRVTFPFRRIETLRDAPPGQRRLEGAVTMVHHLFPNVIVARLTRHTAMVVLEPLSVTSTRMVTYRLTNGSAGGADRSVAARDAEFVDVGAVEDREMALAVQRGLASGANATLEFGRFEGAIVHFHRQLAELLNGPPTSRVGSDADAD